MRHVGCTGAYDREHLRLRRAMRDVSDRWELCAVEGCQVVQGKGDAACTLAVLVRTSAQHLHLGCYE